jgi:DNA-binding MarR family transcriptional regulator
MQSLNKVALEHMHVANTYLQSLNTQNTAEQLGLRIEEVVDILDKREIKSYIDRCFNEQAWMSRDRIALSLGNLIDKKLEELEEAGIGSKYDIMDLLKEAHKMSLAERKLAMEEAKVQHQLNIQINNTTNNAYGSNWADLMTKLIKND